MSHLQGLFNQFDLFRTSSCSLVTKSSVLQVLLCFAETALDASVKLKPVCSTEVKGLLQLY